jgi:small subunit ribosomal protein S1
VTDAGGGGNRADAAPHVYRVTKYDPADRDEHGHYVGAEGVFSDHGRVEAAYLAAVVAFAEDSGVTTVAIREPEIVGLAHFDVEPPVEGYGLAGLSGYADESHPLATAVLPDNDGVLRARWTP